MKDSTENSKPTRREFLSRGVWATGLFGLGAAAGVLPKTPSAQPSKPQNRPLSSQESTFDPLFKTDPKLITYEEAPSWPVDLKEIRGMAIGAGNRIGVAGDQKVLVLDDSGARLAEYSLNEAVRCVAVASPERIVACLRNQVVTIQTKDGRIDKWESLGKQALLTSLAVREQDVFVADAGNRSVLHYNLEGRLLGRIRKGEPQPGQAAFIVPSPYFDLVLDGNNQLWVVNPGQHRVEGYSASGQFLESWGQASYAISGFCGCCNPAHLALLPDGRFVTSEKGIPRIKIYSREGRFQEVVAGAESFTPYFKNPNSSPVGLEIAADAKGRVLVGDFLSRKIRVFIPKNPAAISAATL